MGIFKEIPKSDGSGITTFYRISQYRATVDADNDDVTETMFDYNETLNKPSINNITLVGNKTLEDLGIQPAGDYALKSEVPNRVSQLENDSDYATEAFVIAQISSAEHFHREIVDVLPEVGKDNVLYLLKKTGKQGDFYDEYLWMNPGYEFIGTTSTDLTNYYKKIEVDNLLDKKVDKVTGKALSTNDYTTPEKTKLASLENYDDTDLWNTVNALHNYDDTEIKADIAALESQMEGVNSEIEVLDEKIEYQITLIRLIRHGDEWIWENAKNDILTFQDAFNQLGNPDVLLCLENVESDGKVYPSYYNAEDNYVRVYYLDKEHAIHLLSVSATDATDTILGEDVVYQPKVDSVEKLPTIANKGEVRLVGDDDAVYIYDGNKWVPIDKGTAIDLSNYLPKDNTIAFNPTGNYNPATKKYVDDKVGALFIPTKVSQLTNDSQFIGKNTSDLTNYYVKNKLYTRAEVDALIQSGYTLPVATETTLGGVRVGNNLTIDETGKLSAVVSGGSWGSITGTLSDQTDLQNVLDNKLNTDGGVVKGTVTFKQAASSGGLVAVGGDGPQPYSSLNINGLTVSSITTFGGSQVTLSSSGLSKQVNMGGGTGWSLTDKLSFSSPAIANSYNTIMDNTGVYRNYDDGTLVRAPFIRQLTQSQYDALEDKDNNTLYCIVD